MFLQPNLYVAGIRYGGGVLGDSFGSLRDGMLGELTWKEKSDSSLDLSGGESVLLVVSDA